MAIGFDINDNGMVSSTKNVVEPSNFVDGYNPPDSSGGKVEDPVPPNSTSWTTEDVIPNIELSENAKKNFLDNLPEDKKPYAYLGIGALIYYLFLS